MDGAHFLSAGVACFARALNDTPKIVAMLLLMKALDARWGFRRRGHRDGRGRSSSFAKIAETMSKKLIGMNGQGFTAEFLQGEFLSFSQAFFGLPFPRRMWPSALFSELA